MSSAVYATVTLNHPAGKPLASMWSGHRILASKAGCWGEKTLEAHWAVPHGSSGRLDCNYSFRERDTRVERTPKARPDPTPFSLLLNLSPLPSLWPCPQKQLWHFKSEGLFTPTQMFSMKIQLFPCNLFVQTNAEVKKKKTQDGLNESTNSLSYYTALLIYNHKILSKLRSPTNKHCKPVSLFLWFESCNPIRISLREWWYAIMFAH